jgi:hypothetical protein
MKPGKTFNLSKQTKRFMATIVDPVARHAYKNAMIQAELAAAVVVKREPRDNKGGARGTGYTNTTSSATPSA